MYADILSDDRQYAQKQLVITLGDPYSINAEGVAALLAHPSLLNFASSWPVYIIGCYDLFVSQLKSLSKKIPSCQLITKSDEIKDKKKGIIFYHVADARCCADRLELWERGEISVKSLEAVSYLKAKKTAVITSPIDKYCCQLAGFAYPGQTEFFCNLWQADGLMALIGPDLRVGLVTNHLPLKLVSQAISQEIVYMKAKIFCSSLPFILQGKSAVKIAVCGLNPHCGDGGLFGDEDKRIVYPAVERLQEEGFPVFGPLAADTAFYKALRGEYSAVLAMYHDQGLGPLKTVHFDTAVNMTLGLKNLRISPDHGPAKDLYLTGKASLQSFISCLDYSLSYLESGEDESN